MTKCWLNLNINLIIFVQGYGDYLIIQALKVKNKCLKDTISYTHDDVYTQGCTFRYFQLSMPFFKPCLAQILCFQRIYEWNFCRRFSFKKFELTAFYPTGCLYVSTHLVTDYTQKTLRYELHLYPPLPKSNTDFH